MKLTTTFFALLLTTSAAFSQGYEIKVTLKPFKNQYIYLGHYYGKQLPIIDSVKLNDKSEGVFKGTKKLGGGIYLVGYPDRSQYFEMLVDKNQKFAVAADTAAGRQLTFTNSPDNDEFIAYQQFMSTHGRNIEALMQKRAAQPKDSAAITVQIQALNKQIQDYRRQLMTKNPDALLPALLRAMKEPEVPQQTPEARKDSMFAYKYFKSHY
ncbi:MAG TPA: DUF4369 domain-containing protein, partial [Flavisolibacter sp.]|nr:DUF4369 domain-containing protein [Flavisolibacter sp.]